MNSARARSAGASRGMPITCGCSFFAPKHASGRPMRAVRVHRCATLWPCISLYLWSKGVMDHETAIRVQAAERYLLDEFSPEERTEFEDHFFGCSECADEVRA